MAFDKYVQRTGTEIINGWLQNEAISIQQGNLLTSITKNQRILLSSDFIQGITLVDSSRVSFQNLISFGENFKTPSTNTIGLQELKLIRTGIFQFVALVPLDQTPNLNINFFIAPKFASALFILYVVSLVGLILVSLFHTLTHERAESARRTELLQIAINDFASGNEPSMIIKEISPKLIERWNDLKNQLKDSQQKEIQLGSSARFADLAQQVSHDIRSPLSALNMMLSSLNELPEAKRLILRSASQRINDIANSLIQKMSNFHHVVPPNFLNTVPLDFHDRVPADFHHVVPRHSQI
jgi:signal transduction histidine kinase